MGEYSIDLALFDWGGVLAEEGFIQGLQAIAAKNGLEAEPFFWGVRDVVYATGYVYGRCDEAAFWRAFAEKYPQVQGTPEEWRHEIFSRFVPRPWMFDIVRRLKASGIQVAVLSDQVNWLDELEEKFGFAKEFHRVFNSFHHGVSKQEPEFFHLALREMGGVPPERALLVDDASFNVKLARELGLHAIHCEEKDGCISSLQAHFDVL